ncbi:MAG: ATP-binding protein [Phycisphaerae bacterium]
MTATSTAVMPDLTNCEKEPIHIPGSIQPHGALLVLREADLIIEHASANTAKFLGCEPVDLLNKPITSLLSDQQLAQLHAALTDELNDNPIFVFEFAPREARNEKTDRRHMLNAVLHRRASRLILDFDPPSPHLLASRDLQRFYPMVRASIQRLEAAHDLRELYRVIAEEVRRITGFERVMIYKFDEDWHGEVVGEALAEGAASYMNHHFPASDIPAQARNLYRVNRSRVIVDAAYQPVPLVRASGAATTPVDLSFSILRSVSPVHAEYLRNMGVAASTSFSIIRDGELWGLIACHHSTPFLVPFEIRTACEFLSQVAAIEIGAQIRRTHDANRLRLQSAQSKLLAEMTREDNLLSSLARAGSHLIEFLGANGAALYFDKQVTLLGATPSEQQVRAIIDFIDAQKQRDIFTTDSLPTLFPLASAFKDTACGVLAMSISRYVNSYLLWFRPERIRTITWGGDPNKPAEPALPGARIHPRKSFENWKQIIENHANPWLPEEIEAATDFRSSILNIVLRKVEELAGLSAELKRANSELESFSYSISHDLRAPFRHIAGFADLLQRRAVNTLDETGRRYVQTIGEAARHAGALVDALLAFSNISRIELRKLKVPLADLVEESRRDLADLAKGRNVQWNVPPLPVVRGDPTLLRLVLDNLIANALKFTRHRDPAIIDITAKYDGARYTIAIKDNGAGFDHHYIHKLFTPFSRLHRAEEFEGTGIGLATVKRVVERHGGAVWAQGAVDRGSTFYFSLPLQEPPSERA